ATVNNSTTCYSDVMIFFEVILVGEVQSFP
ncbi:MAG: hypothetical protein ACI9HJ_001590, partial [Ulvibacter sp.]